MIRVAILGAGIGAEHLIGYRAVPGRFAVTKLCDQDTDRAARVGGGDPTLEICATIEAALEDPMIDLIDICLPPHLHAPVAQRALQAGKHVICEKPIARGLAEVDRLIATAEASGKQVFPVFQYRYGPGMSQIRALMEAGLAGRAYAASLETHWDRDAAYYAMPWRGTWAGENGGAVISHAIHAHDLLCTVMGPVAAVAGFADTRVNGIETEDTAALSLRMANGALATSSITLGASGNTSRLRFCFEGFTAESGTAPYAPASQAWRFTARAPRDQRDIDAVADAHRTAPIGFAGYLTAVADALDGAGGREVTLAHGRQSIELATAIYATIRSGKAIGLPLSPDAPLYDGWMPAPPSGAERALTTPGNNGGVFS